MYSRLRVIRVLVVFAPLLAPSPAAPAAALPTWNRVFMSTNGNDANNCSSQATPCLTFIGAQAQTNVGGEIIAMATGGYGQLTITQSVTINGPAGVVIFSNFPVTVNAHGATVVLRGLTIDGTGQTTGHGVNVLDVAVLHVESCVIAGWAGTSGSNGSGIYFATAGQLFVKDSILRGNGTAGIYVTPPSGTALASVDHCRLEQNGYGLVSDNELGGSAKATIRDSVASGTTYYALIAQYGGHLSAEGCLVTGNGTGLEAYAAGSVLRASNCTVTDNTLGLFNNAGALLSRGNNTVEGNGSDGTFSGSYSVK